jgi:hypothetical protein
MRTSLGAAALFAALCSLPGCPPPARGGGLRVDAAVARLAPGGAGAAYLEITNGTDTDDRLLAVDAADVGSTGLHEVVTSGDLARMVARPEGFVVPRHATLTLQPGGKHVMLFGVERAGDRRSIPLLLHFEHARAIEVDARVLFAVAGE